MHGSVAPIGTMAKQLPQKHGDLLDHANPRQLEAEVHEIILAGWLPGVSRMLQLVETILAQSQHHENLSAKMRQCSRPAENALPVHNKSRSPWLASAEERTLQPASQHRSGRSSGQPVRLQAPAPPLHWVIFRCSRDQLSLLLIGPLCLMFWWKHTSRIP